MSSNQQPVSPGAKPHVIIVGAGIGGLTLALLLERAGVSYAILEKTSSIKPLGNENQISIYQTLQLPLREDSLNWTDILFSFSSGSALSVNGQVTYLFRQLGIFEDFKNNSLTFEQVQVYDGDCKPDYTLDFTEGPSM